MGMAGKHAPNHLHPPGNGSLKDLLAWLDSWRIVPVGHPRLGEAEAAMKKLAEGDYIQQVETAFGRGWGLAARGARLLGDPRRAVSHASPSFLGHRLALYLAADTLGEGVEVLALERNRLVLKHGERILRMGWRSGDLVVGLATDKGADVRLAVPKERVVSPYDLTDQEWLDVSPFLLPIPGKRLRRYWTRTLTDGCIAIRTGHGKELLHADPALYRAAYRFGRQPGVWEVIAARVRRFSAIEGRKG